MKNKQKISNEVKKSILQIILFLAVFLIPSAVLAAAGFSLAPQSANYTAGQLFQVTISVNPQGDAIYTAKAELTYPADLIEIRSFTFTNGWMGLAQPGYDLTDNKNGVLIKTGGWPGGFSSAKNLGTVLFYVKKTGSAIIKISDNSLALNAENKNVFDGKLSQAVFNLAEANAGIQPKTTTPEESQSTIESAIPSAQETQPSEQPAKKSFLAQVISNDISPVILFGLVGLIVGFFVGRKTKLIKI